MIASYGMRAVARNARLASWPVGMALVLVLAAFSAPAAAPGMQLLVLGDSLAAGYGLPASDGFEP
ncbi:MAG: hypothetical protein KGI51_16590, partial [Rhodospirillales bacterium]|nr:hypothetical protein [Rhodospirillales bacterium]